MKLNKAIKTAISACNRSNLDMTAGDRNRTDMTSLEGWGFTIKLRPHGRGDYTGHITERQGLIPVFYENRLIPRQGSICIKSVLSL